MCLKINSAIATSIAIALSVSSYSGIYASESNAVNRVENSISREKKTASMEDIRSKRNLVRRDLMFPSLRGIRGLAYGAIADDHSKELEAAMIKHLKQLDIPIYSFSSLKSGVKPIDGLLELKVVKVPTAERVQLNLYQWVSLLRQPKTEIRAITYNDASLCTSDKLETTTEELTNQFVVDVLKANQQRAVVSLPVKQTKKR